MDKVNNNLLKSLAEILNSNKDSHEKGWKKVWANAFVNVGWRKAL